jgi:hypothetical protein
MGSSLLIFVSTKFFRKKSEDCNFENTEFVNDSVAANKPVPIFFFEALLSMCFRSAEETEKNG